MSAAARVMAALALLVGLLVGTPPAGAHTDVVASTPAAGDVVGGDVGRIALVFGEDVDPATGQVVVLDPDRRTVAAGGTPVTGSALELEVPVLQPGTHEVLYRVTGDDGHPVVGRYEFTVRDSGGASAGGPPPAETASGPLAAAEGRSLAPWALGGVGVALVVVLVHRARRGRTGPTPTT